LVMQSCSNTPRGPLRGKENAGEETWPGRCRAVAGQTEGEPEARGRPSRRAGTPVEFARPGGGLLLRDLRAALSTWAAAPYGLLELEQQVMEVVENWRKKMRTVRGALSLEDAARHRRLECLLEAAGGQATWLGQTAAELMSDLEALFEAQPGSFAGELRGGARAGAADVVKGRGPRR